MLSIKGFLRRFIFGEDFVLLSNAEYTKVQSLLSGFEPGGEYANQLIAWRRYFTEFSPEYIQRIKNTADEAHTMACGSLPVSSIVAAKVGGETIVAGIKS